MDMDRIYCSGPLFCAEEVGGMSAIAAVLEAEGFRTFLPHRDGLEGYVMRFGNVSVPPLTTGIRRHIDHAIFSLDVYEIVEGCSAVVCNLNGRVPDEGMIVEAALAYAAAKPLVLFKDDVRAPFGGHDNSMLTGLVHGRIVNRLKDLPSALRREMSRERVAVSLSHDLRKAVSCGRRVSRVLEGMPGDLGRMQWTDEVIRKVMRVMEEAHAQPPD